jgi:hypothetical protein
MRSLRSIIAIIAIVIPAITLVVATGCARSQEAKKDGGGETAATVTTDQGAKQVDNLDGKTFTATSTEAGKDSATTDELIFANGTFRSKECDQYGFAPASYTTQPDGDGLAWEATSLSDKEGKMVWKGKVVGKTIEGMTTWIKAGQNNIDYTFTGSMP